MVTTCEEENKNYSRSSMFCVQKKKNMKFKAKIAPRLTIFVAFGTAVCSSTLWEITDQLEEICCPRRKERGAFGYSFVGACKNLTVSLVRHGHT